MFEVPDSQGNFYHAFIEVCDKVFSGTPRQTIKSRMRTLGLNLVRCPTSVLDIVRKARPGLSNYKVISLIAKRDVSVLQAYHQSRVQNESSRCFNLGNANSCASYLPKASRDLSFIDFSQRAKNQSLALPFRDVTSTNLKKKQNLSALCHAWKTTPTATTDTVNRCQSFLGTTAAQVPWHSESTCASKPANWLSKEMDEEEEEEEEEDEEDDDEEEGREEDGGGEGEEDTGQEETLKETERQGEEENVSFDPGESCADVRLDEVDSILESRGLDRVPFKRVMTEIKAMKTFYTSEFNHKRRSGKMAMTTWQKLVERLVTFLSFGASKLEVKPSLALVRDLPLVESFISHLRTDRRVQNSTAGCYIQSLVTTSKYLGADQRYGDFQGDSVSSDLRALRRQLERAKTFTDKMPDVRLLWPQYQELVRNLHCQYQDAPAANKARLHMDFTMLLLFAVNPGRGRELRTLRLLTEMPEGGVQTLLRRLPEGDNVVVISDNGPVWLVETGYKTAAKYGPNVVQFDQEFDFLTHHLREYRTRSRPRLLCRDSSHDYFFVNKRGMPFRSSSSFSLYLSTIFKRNLGLPCGINEMRHALVEHFRSSPESSDARLAEFLARVCKHTLRTQISIYDRRTQQERTSQALRYLGKSAFNSILDEPPTTSFDKEQEIEQAVDSDDLPSPGELCALIPCDVNPGRPDVFLAKVLKYTHDGRDARLAWLRELDTRPNYYEFQAGTDVWQEKTSALIYPIDVHFHRLEGLYELKTPKRRIYTLVRKPSTQL